MKLWRIAAQVALISVFTVLSASAIMFNTRFTAIPDSALPADGPTTTLVRGNVEAQTMIVHFTCGQPSPCIVTGDQMSWEGFTAVMIAPEGANTPGPYFIFGYRPECAVVYGNEAYTGLWISEIGNQVVSQQCFVQAESRYTTRPNRPPVRRIERAELPSNIAEMRATARARAQARARAAP